MVLGHTTAACKEITGIEPKADVTMEFQYKLDYNKLSDRQIVEKILAEPHDEEAAAYLLHDRYAPLLYRLYRQLLILR